MIPLTDEEQDAEERSWRRLFRIAKRNDALRGNHR